jgi:hypothetical protein
VVSVAGVLLKHGGEVELRTISYSFRELTLMPVGARDADAAETVLPPDNAQGLRTIGDPVIRR